MWTPINRPADTHVSRERYIEQFQPLEEERALRSTIVILCLHLDIPWIYADLHSNALSSSSSSNSLRSCLRSFFAQGWCLGSSGAMACRVGRKENAPMLVTPSGVPKEQLEEEETDFSC